MVHAYHVIMPMYGFWLPNDPRGSWSDFIRKWELLRYGGPTHTLERRRTEHLSELELSVRKAACAELAYPPVSLDEHQIAGIARGFADKVKKCGYRIWACSILPEHTHLVVARHSYKVEVVANLLKGASTTALMNEGRHPLAAYAKPGKCPPRMWAARQWKIYLDTIESVEEAVRYVEQNPVKEGRPRQIWPFVTPFPGRPSIGGHVTYHD
jgi:REP element-mobilizing transposase RayT